MDKLGKELAQAYMESYDEAMAKTYNETFAGQVAAVVTMAIANRPQPQQQASALTSHIFNMILKSEEPKKKPGRKTDQKKEDGKSE